MKYSKTGYRRNSKDRKNPFNIIPSNRISMKNVDIPLFAISDTGDTRIMFPNEEHLFGGTRVVEIPMKKKGGKCFECGGTKMQDGGETPNQKVVRLARERADANNWITSIPQEILNTEEGRGHEGYTCIGGVCQVLTDAGLMKSPIWSNTEFERRAKELGFSNPVYSIDNLEPGDVLQWRQAQNKEGKYYPSHAQIFLGRKEDGSFEVFDNFSKQIKSYPEQRMREVLSPMIGDKRNKESAQIIKLNPKNIKGMGLNESQKEELGKAYAESYTPARYSRKGRISSNSPYYYLSRQDEKDKLVDLLNDTNLDREIREASLIDDARLQQLKPIVYGIIGQESNFNNPTSAKAQLKYLGENIGFTPLIQRTLNQYLKEEDEFRPSLGPAQQQIENINKRTAKRFGINTDSDLTDLKKSYVAAITSLNNAEKYTSNFINNGSRYELKDVDPFIRALYWNNNPSNVVKSAAKDEYDADEKAYNYAISQRPNLDLNPNSPDYDKNWSEIQSLKKDWKKQNLLRVDKGSYPRKVLEAASDLNQSYFLDTDNAVGTLTPVTIKGKKKDNTFIGPPELQSGGVIDPSIEVLSKAVVFKNRNLPWVDRALHPEKYPIKNQKDFMSNGKAMSHRIGWGEGENGEFQVFPTIGWKNDSLQWNDRQEPIRVRDRKLAEFLSQNGIINHRKKQFGGNSGDIIEQQLMRMQLGGENDFTPLSMTSMVTGASGPSISKEKLNPSYLGQFKPMFVTNSLTREKSMIDPNNLYQQKTSSGIGIPPSYINAVVGAFGKRKAQLRQEQQIQDQLANPFNSIPIVTTQNRFLNEGMSVKQEGGEVEDSYENEEEFLFGEDEQEQQQQPIQIQEEEIEEEEQQPEEEDYFSILSLDDDDDDDDEDDEIDEGDTSIEKVTYPSSTNSSQPSIKSSTSSTATSDSEISKIAESIGQYESGNDYSEVGPVVTKGRYKGQRALGKYQIMPGNIPEWSKEALGREVSTEEFLNNPEIQDAIAYYQMKKIHKKYGSAQDVASVWFTGRPSSKKVKSTDDLGTSQSQYIKNVMGFYNK